MRRLIVIICFYATVSAAPQAYLYNQQQNGLSAGFSDFSSSSQVAGSTKATQDNHGFLQQAVNSGSLSQTLLSGQPAVHNAQQFSTVPSFSALQQQQHAPVINNFGGQQQQHQYQQQHQGALSSNFGLQQQQFNRFPQQQQQHQQQYQIPGTVTKDIYVHVAPEDTQDQQYQQRQLASQPPRKHYRIVFIKAPSQHINNAALRAQQAPTEEKTIIYVLTKKADPLDLQNAIQEIQPKQPSKPEVYFIKYKTQAEAQHAQRTIQAQYDKLGGSSQVSDEGIAPVTSVIGSLDNTQQQEAPLDFSTISGHSSSSNTLSSASSGFTSSGANNNDSKYLPPIVKL